MIKEMKDEDFIVSKTDKKGKITYVNKIFMDMAEYTEAELLGKPHSIIRHPKMPKIVFKLLWDRIEKKEEIFAFVLNKTKNSNGYWVYANITASLDENENIIGYYSVRRRPNPQAIKIIEPIYEKMIEAEKTGGMEASEKILENLLFEKGVSYDELVISLQG
ncbi:PAS domain-containing protein [Sulfurimonas lithotrophica]|uniref:PAS domain-containing protein n=2 Tax=Sulfurimonas lithotrophica TaxID=2590022 RepID=A0A5P8NXX4_9BACT|nr:PAS domain-containing protein [Sulfurimonas lithotrophica]